MSSTERIRDSNADPGDEDDCTAPTHDAIQIYNKFKDTDFTAGPRKPGDERNEWEANKNLFAKALSWIRAKVISNTKVLLCTQQLASSTLIRKNFMLSRFQNTSHTKECLNGNYSLSPASFGRERLRAM